MFTQINKYIYKKDIYIYIVIYISIYINKFVRENIKLKSSSAFLRMYKICVSPAIPGMLNVEVGVVCSISLTRIIIIKKVKAA